MKIYQNSNEPIYKQIASQLREQILTGKLKAGEPLPSIRILAQNLKISAITTMKAYEELAAEGLIASTKGKGYFVSPQDEKMLIEQHMRKLDDGLTEAIKAARVLGFDLTQTCEFLRNLWYMED